MEVTIMMESVITEEEHYVPTWEERKAYMQSVAPPCAEVVRVAELGGVKKLLASFECAVPFQQALVAQQTLANQQAAYRKICKDEPIDPFWKPS
jgi:hypothetical protein